MLVLLKQDFPFSVWMGMGADREEYFNSMIVGTSVMNEPPPPRGTDF